MILGTFPKTNKYLRLTFFDYKIYEKKAKILNFLVKFVQKQAT